MEITESALTERPQSVLRTLTRLRTCGWGVSLDDYPDVIKLDLALLSRRAAADMARVVTAVGAEAERRHATVLAEHIDLEAQLDLARACGATLGQGVPARRAGAAAGPAAVARAAAAARGRRRRRVRAARTPQSAFEALRESLGFVGVLEPGVLEATWTEVALGPGFGACFVAPRGRALALRDLL